MNIGVYYISNEITHEGYIGSSKVLTKRFKQHRAELCSKRHHNRHLQNAYNKYGEVAFKFEVLAECPVEYQYKLEQWFLDHCKLDHSYNICKDALLPPLLVYTDQIRKNISVAAKIRANRKEEKVKLSNNAIKIWKNPEHRIFMQELNKGEKHPKAKITEEIARSIKQDIQNKVKRGTIIKKYDVSLHIYKSIKANKSWKHVQI